MEPSAICLECLDMLGAAFAHEVTPQMTVAYMAALQDLTDEQVQAATLEALRTSRFFPRPAELLAYAAPTNAWLAWEVFRAASRRGDGRQSLRVDDVVLAHTVRSMGGWAHACHLTTADMVGYYRTEWLKTYREYEARHRQSILPPFLLLGATAEPVRRLKCDYVDGMVRIQ